VDSLIGKLRNSPVAARGAPFAIFLALTWCQGLFGEASCYWFYLAKTLVGAWLLWSLRSVILEMRWAWSWEALATGLGVFLIWVGLDGHYPSIDQLCQEYLCPALKAVRLESWCPKPAAEKLPWNPNLQFGNSSVLAYLFIAVRLIGPSIVVPPLEEVFYRSFLYRYIIKPNFESVAMGTFRWTAFLLTSVIFGVSHHEWLAGILCGLAFQILVWKKKRLGDAMTAHAITNLLLGLWVVWRGAWHFW
jgi:membrane protease YdiL (CAAX protease family)